MDYQALADVLFPEVTGSVAAIKEHYPDRPEGQLVCRFAPSPTGFLHLGGVYTAFLNSLLARQQDGVFVLRIEDTDQQRKIEGGIGFMANGLQLFGIDPDEGRVSETDDRGVYGPYLQSERLDYYRVFMKYLVSIGGAYPCWLTREEIDAIREGQKVAKQTTGVYGQYARWRDASMEDIQTQLDNDVPFVIRLKADGVYGTKRVFADVVRGDVSMQEHFVDTVLIKADGYPTYHFAHLVDDYLMGTSHVIRAEEWLASVPLHVALFESFGFVPPAYAHLAQLLKLADGKKRKLSKRYDMESDVKALLHQGFAPQGILEYCMTIFSPAYEQWQLVNPTASFVEHTMSLAAMNKSGALVDYVKMQQINREYLARLSNEELYDICIQWCERALAGLIVPSAVTDGGDDFPFADFLALLCADKTYMLAAIGIERHTPKDPKRFVLLGDVYDQVRFFADDVWQASMTAGVALPDAVSAADAKAFLASYEEAIPDIWHDSTVGVQEWFGHLREFGQEFGYAVNNKQYKEGGWKGKVGDLAMLLRLVLCCVAKTPDLYSVMQVMGRARVSERVATFVASLDD